MGEQPQRDRKQAPLSLLKIVFPRSLESTNSA